MWNYTNLNEKKRVAIYCRVSTDEQVVHWNWLEYQKQALLDYISAFKSKYTFNEKHTYIDEWQSWASNKKEERTALYEMFKSAQNWEFDVLLVWKVDRFFRKTLYLLEWIEALDRLWVDFISITQPFHTENWFWKMWLNMMWVIAELERDLIWERTRAWILASMKKWKWSRWYVPYWYKKNEDWYLEINEEEAKIIKWIIRMLLDESLTLNAIINRLNLAWVETWSFKWKLWKRRQENLKHENFWHRASVQRILTNELYTWVLIQNRYKRLRWEKTRVERPKEEWIINDCPAIITKEEFAQIQAQLEKNRRYSIRNKKEKVKYMLSTLLYDKETWYKYSWYLSRKNTKNYRLDLKNKVKDFVPQKWVSWNKIETAVWKKIAMLLDNPKLLLEELKRLKEMSKDRDVEAEIKLLETEKSKLERRSKNLLRFASDLDNDSVEDIKTMLEENRNCIVDINFQISDLEKYITTEEQKERQLKDLKRLAKNLVGQLDKLSYEEKTEICRLLIDRVDVNWNELEITILVPSSAESEKPSDEMIEKVFSNDNLFIDTIEKDLPNTNVFNKSDSSFAQSLNLSTKLCSYNGRGRGTWTHNPTLPKRVR